MKIQEAMMNAKEKIKKATEEFEKIFGRNYGNGLIQEYKMDNADVGMLIYGDLALQMEEAVDEVRNEGYKVGMVKLRHFRPFPVDNIIDIAKKVKVLGVIDRAQAFGSQTGGPVSNEVKTALHDIQGAAQIFPMMNGIGGREVTLDQQKDQLKILIKINETGEIPGDLLSGTLWHGKLEVK